MSKHDVFNNMKERLETARLMNEGEVLRQKDIEEKTAALTGLDPDLVKRIFDASWSVMFREIEQGNTVKLHGWGKFYLSERSARMGRNPVSGVEYEVDSREVLSFQTSKAYARKLKKYRDFVNAKYRK